MAAKNAETNDIDKTCTVDNVELSCNNGGPVNVLGLDPSQNMIAVGRDKIKDRHLENVIKLGIADARSLTTVEDNSFDKITMAFGIRNVPEREEVLCEMHRVLNKKQGNRSKMAILEFSEPDENCEYILYYNKYYIYYYNKYYIYF